MAVLIDYRSLIIISLLGRHSFENIVFDWNLSASIVDREYTLVTCLGSRIIYLPILR